MKKLMKKAKSWLNSKKARMGVALAGAALSLCSVASAAEAGAEGSGGIDTTAISSAFSSGLTNVVTMSIGLIQNILPIAITLFGVMFLVKKAPKWFQKMAG